MVKKIVRRLWIVGLSLVLTVGFLVGCGSGDTDSTSAQTPEQQVEQQSEKDHEHNHDQGESSHEKHRDEGDEEDHDHDHGHDRMDHFEGKEANTYDEAVSNMKEANSRLEDLLAKNELAGEDFFQIHRMSYTMENALAVIREESDGEYEDVAQSLEAVHLASEKQDAQTVRQEGNKYLEGARAMLEKE